MVFDYYSSTDAGKVRNGSQHWVTAVAGDNFLAVAGTDRSWADRRRLPLLEAKHNREVIRHSGLTRDRADFLPSVQLSPKAVSSSSLVRLEDSREVRPTSRRIQQEEVKGANAATPNGLQILCRRGRR
jgi:hypothetical protein